jgi:RNA polymerase sigma-70 factor (sigma-E family)
MVKPAAAAARLPESFTAVFDHLYRHSFRAAFRLVGDRHEAEDIAQEACARACLHWPRLSKWADATPWAVRVASNLAIDHWRRRQRSQRAAGQHVPGVVTPSDARRLDLHRALESLPRRQRDVVVLRYVVDLTEAETAEALGCAPGTVKSHASRGLASLRDALEGDES